MKGWSERRGEEALIYTIPNHDEPRRPREKGVTVGELDAAYEQLTTTGKFTHGWFNKHLPKCAAEGSCNFTTIGGLFELLGVASYAGRGLYVAASADPT